MRRILLTSSLSLLAVVAAGAAGAAPRLSPAQLWQAIRDFHGDPNFVLVRVGEPRFTRHGLWQGASIRRAGDQQEITAWYEVDCLTGEVVRMHVVRQPSDDEVPPRLSVEQGFEIALAFARRHYRGFGHRPTKFLGSGLLGTGPIAYYTWSEVLNVHGARAPHVVYVWVHTGTGAVVHYMGWHPRVTGPTVPRLSRREALEIASQLAPWDPREFPLQVTDLQLWPDEAGVQRLRWWVGQFEKEGVAPSRVGPLGRELAPREGDVHGAIQREPLWEACIDAITGAVISTHAPIGMSPARGRSPRAGVRAAQPPALWLNRRPVELALGVRYREGRAYVPVEVAQLLGWWVERRPGRRWARLVGIREPERTLAVAAPVRPRKGSAVMLVDGHLFVSVRWLASWCGATVEWDRERRRVLLTAPEERVTRG